VVSTANVGLQAIGNSCIADSLSLSPFEPQDMTREPIVCFLILQSEYLGGNLANWFRLTCGIFVDGAMRSSYRVVPVLGMLD